jgi:two-component system sensor histidine kinase KdpD
LSSVLEDSLDSATQRELLKTAHEEARRLNRLVGHLLDMSRLEAGALKVSWQPCDVQDVIGAALQQLNGLLANRPIEINVPADLPLVPLDFVLVVQALVNVLENAAKYSPPTSPIDIRAQVVNEELEIQITDRGQGIPPGDLTRVFTKFYRVQHATQAADRSGFPPGTGLGLSISGGIIEAHGGRIWAQNRLSGGTTVSLTLPINEGVL